MDPFCPAAGGLQCSPPLGAQQTLGLDTESAGPAQPAPNGHLQDAIARLWGQEGQGLTQQPKMNILPDLLHHSHLSHCRCIPINSRLNAATDRELKLFLATFPVFTWMLTADQCVLAFNYKLSIKMGCSSCQAPTWLQDGGRQSPHHQQLCGADICLLVSCLFLTHE